MKSEESIFDRPQFSPLSLAQTAWKQKLLILSVWLLISVVTVAVVQTLPPVYQAEAVILLEAQRIPSNFVAPTVGSDLRDRLSSLRQQVLSHTRLSELIETFGLYPEQAETANIEMLVGRMRNDIYVELERGMANDSPAFRVGYSGANPEIVTRVADRLASLFIDQDLRQREVEAVSTSQFLDSQLDAARKGLEGQEARLSNYKKAHNGELPQQEGALLGTLSRLAQQIQADREAMRLAQQERTLAEASLEDAMSSLRELRILTKGGPPRGDQANEADLGSAPVTQTHLIDPTFNQLRTRLNSLRQQYTDNHPDVVRAREALDQHERAVQRAQQERAVVGGADSPLPAREPRPGLNSDFASILAPDLQRREHQVDDIEKRIAALNGRMEILSGSLDRRQREMAEVEMRVANLPLREQDLAAVVRDYEISKANYQSLLRRKMDADLATEMERRQKSERFVLLDPPRVPEKPIKPQRLLLGLLGSGIGLVCGVLIGFGRELKKNVFLGEWELPSHVEVLGRIPEFSVVGAASSGGFGGRQSTSGVYAKVRSLVIIVLATWAQMGFTRPVA